MNQRDDLTTRLSHQLHDQVDDWHDAPLTLESVRGRAHSIRRTRRMVVAGVAAVAVAAIAIPASLLGTPTGRSDRPPEIAETPTEAVAPTPRADGTFPLTLDVPEGPAPATGYIDMPGQVLRSSTGDRALPGDLAQLERFGDGWLGLESGRFGELGTRLVRLDQDLEVVDSVLANALVVDADGEHAAWVEVAGEEWTLVQASPEGELARTEVDRNTVLAGHLSGDRVVFQTTDLEGGGSVFGVVDGDGSVSPLDGRLRLLSADETGNRVTAMTKYGVHETCYVVLDATSSEGQVETCDFEPQAFSPDGSLVVGVTPGDDGLGSPTLAILDATTLEPVVEWSTARGDRSPALVNQVVWEDDGTLVATVTEGTNQAVVRADLDGSVQRVAEPAEIEMSWAYRLPQVIWNLG